MSENSISEIPDSKKSREQLIEELSKVRARLFALERDKQLNLQRLDPSDTDEHHENDRQSTQNEDDLSWLFTMLEAAPDIMSYSSPDGRILYLNRTGRDILGIPYEKPLQGIQIQSCHPDWTNRLFTEIAIPTAIRDGYWMGETAVLRPDGSQMPVSQIIIAHRDDTGQVRYLSTICRDLSERKAVETKLRDSEQRYRTLFETMVEGFALHEIITDDKESPCDYRFLDVNPAFEKLTGLKRSDLVGRRVLEVLPGIEKRWIDNYGRVALTGESLHMEEYSSELKRWYSVFAYRTAPGQFAALFTDITSLKVTEALLEQENREIALLNRVLGIFTESTDDALFGDILDVVLEGLNSRHGMFGYITESGHLTCPSLSRMLDECEVQDKSVHFPPERWNGLWARALLEKRSMYTNTPSAVPEGHPVISNNLAAPILFRGEAIGLLNLANKSGGYAESDRMVLEAVADRIAPLLYAWLQKRLREEERARAEKELRMTLIKAEEGDRMFSALMDYVPEGITVADADLNLIRVSRFGQQLLGNHEGKTVESVASQWTIFHADGKTPMAEEDVPLVRAVRQGEIVRNVELIEINERGEHIPLLCNAGPIRDYSGNIIGGIAAWRDISDRKRISESLRRLSQFPEENPLPVMRISSEGELLYANTAAKDLLRTLGYQNGGTLPHAICLAVSEARARSRVIESEITNPDGRTFGFFTVKPPGERYVNLYGMDLTERKKAERTLRENEKRIRATLAEKEVMLKEIHHRVKNNMQVISSLVSLKAEELRDDTMCGVLGEVSHRIRSMALVHEKLYQSTDLAVVEFDQYAKSLVNYLWNAYGTYASPIILKEDLDTVTLPVNEAVPCGLILNELVSNALKHAFQGRSDGEVTVSLRQDGQNRVCLGVYDNGRGFPEGLDWRNANSLGLRLLHMLGEQLHADVDVTSSENGTHAEIAFDKKHHGGG